MVHRSDEPYDGNEQQEDAHRDDPSDDVDARHDAEPLPPRRYADQQQPDQLKGGAEERCQNSVSQPRRASDGSVTMLSQTCLVLKVNPFTQQSCHEAEQYFDVYVQL